MLLNNFTLRVASCVLCIVKYTPSLKISTSQIPIFSPNSIHYAPCALPYAFSPPSHRGVGPYWPLRAGGRIPTSDFQSLPHPAFRIQLDSFDLLSTKQPIGFDH
jgi:hypothetical protein